MLVGWWVGGCGRVCVGGVVCWCRGVGRCVCLIMPRCVCKVMGLWGRISWLNHVCSVCEAVWVGGGGVCG